MKNKNKLKNCHSILMTLVIVNLLMVGLVEPAFAVPSTDINTGCLSTTKGTLYNFQAGTAPRAACLSGDTIASFVNRPSTNVRVTRQQSLTVKLADKIF